MTGVELPPGLILILGAVCLPFVHCRIRSGLAILILLIAFGIVWLLEPQSSWQIRFLGYNLTILRVDRLSKAFAYIFTLNGLAAFVYGLRMREVSQQVAALLYIGASLGVVFAGDLITLYLFWEIMAIASVFLVLGRKTSKAQAAGVRYILVHVFGGLCLLAGIMLHLKSVGHVSFGPMEKGSQAAWLILVGFLVNAAAPPFSAWLPDAYPESTVFGGVILSAYTTKTAVYTLVRAYPEWDILIWIGCIMTIYGIIYALLENDMRRILAYSIINQVGFMIAGVGIGTMISLNGTVAHAFCHIIYKALLWMSAGAVLHMTGKSKCTELGGLYKTMPWTLLFACIGALSISSFPGTSGFTSKSLIIEGAVQAHLPWVWLVLEIASAGVFLHAGIKFPYFVFFAKDSGLRPKETDRPMLLAMAFMSFLCVFLGVYPDPLYRILPYDVSYQAYTFPHVNAQLQLLFFSALAFFLLLGLLKRTETISIDTDWIYRKGGRAFHVGLERLSESAGAFARRLLVEGLAGGLARMSQDGPARLVILFLSPIWSLGRGSSGGQLSEKREAIRRAVAAGAMPVGLGAAAATLFLFVLFMLS